MSNLADSYGLPKDVAGLCWYMADAIHNINRHFLPTGEVTQEDVHMMWSCILQRLEQLEIKRPE